MTGTICTTYSIGLTLKITRVGPKLNLFVVHETRLPPTVPRDSAGLTYELQQILGALGEWLVGPPAARWLGASARLPLTPKATYLHFMSATASRKSLGSLIRAAFRAEARSIAELCGRTAQYVQWSETLPSQSF